MSAIQVVNRVCERWMTPVVSEVGAVLKAADEWVEAQEALVAARQGCRTSETEREVLDIAGSRLVVAVMRWRRLDRDFG
jgi:hypothetical protein